MSKSSLESRFWELLGKWKIQDQFVREFRFDPERMWKFDFCAPVHKLGVELEGGVFSGGRHVRGTGFTKDIEKYNRATAMGYRVFRFATLRDMEEFYYLFAELLENDLQYGVKGR